MKSTMFPVLSVIVWTILLWMHASADSSSADDYAPSLDDLRYHHRRDHPQHHECMHDNPSMQRLLHQHGMDNVVPQRYESDPQQQGDMQMGRTQALGSLRIVTSLLDVYDNTKYCTSVGQTVPDFFGGTMKCTSESEILTPQKRQILLTQLIPQAIAMLSSRLQVERIRGNLSIQDGCETFTMPADHKQHGVPDADLVLYVGATLTPGAAMAWAGYCATDQANRPVVGCMNFNPKFIDSNSVAHSVRILVHEMVHALGFSKYHWENAVPHLVATRMIRGKSTTAFLGPNVIAAARAQFNCSTISFGEMEEGGSNGTAGSHWDMRVYYQELMTGMPFDVHFSMMTLALLKDLGVYTVDMSTAESMDWGKDKGCSFVDETCMSKGVALPSLSHYFCDFTHDGCTFDYKGMGPCGLNVYDTELPPPFRYFDNPRKGGTLKYLDYCPIVTPYALERCDDVTSSWRSSLSIGTYYGRQGRCVLSQGVVRSGSSFEPRQKAMCVRMRCKDGVQVQISMDGASWRDCPADGSSAVVSASAGYLGTVTCPVAQDVCTTELWFGHVETSTTTTTTTTNRNVPWTTNSPSTTTTTVAHSMTSTTTATPTPPTTTRAPPMTKETETPRTTAAPSLTPTRTRTACDTSCTVILCCAIVLSIGVAAAFALVRRRPPGGGALLGPRLAYGSVAAVGQSVPSEEEEEEENPSDGDVERSERSEVELAALEVVDVASPKDDNSRVD